MGTMGFNELKQIFASGYANLSNNKQSVNDLNVFPVPDGDTGTNMTLTMQYAVEEMNKTDATSVGEIAAAISAGALMGARGNSGVILSQLLRGFSKSVISKDKITILDTAQALESATKMAYKAVMQPTEGTILTVAREMSEFAMANAKNYESGRVFMKDVIANGKRALEKTPDLLPVLKEAGVVDSGGTGLILILEGILSAMNGEVIELYEAEMHHETTAKFDEHVNNDIHFQYCTEFLVRTNGKQKHKDRIVPELLKLGDSLVCIEDDTIIKIHVHTNEPWNAMKLLATCGEFVKVKVENMKQQHHEMFYSELENKDKGNKPTLYSEAHVKYVVVSVSSGDGLSEILRNLGVDYVIEGGQTMNPSTQSFIDVINKTNADNYILLPNNKNIILAAEQAQKISDKNVRVLPTLNFPSAVSALMNYNPEVSMDENLESMAEGMDSVTSGNVTFAVRDSLIDGIDIKQNDIIAFAEGKLAACEKDVETATEKLIDKMIDGDSEIISLYFGSDVTREEAEEFCSKIADKYPDLDVEVFSGGQPLYYYIVSVE